MLEACKSVIWCLCISDLPLAIIPFLTKNKKSATNNANVLAPQRTTLIV